MCSTGGFHRQCLWRELRMTRVHQGMDPALGGYRNRARIVVAVRIRYIGNECVCPRTPRPVTRNALRLEDDRLCDRRIGEKLYAWGRVDMNEVVRSLD